MIIKKKIFDNKTTYIHVKNTEQNIFTITLNINIGSKYETKENSGVSHYVEHIFFNNTKKIKWQNSLSYKFSLYIKKWRNDLESY